MLRILRKHRRLSLPILLVLFCSIFTYGLWTSIPAATSDAAINDWIRGASIVPRSPDDFGSESFKQSVWNLKQAGANYVSLVVPWHQASKSSTDIYRGANTPTDASLAAAIDYAHSIGLKVMLKIHVEAADAHWRADINPANRAAWFKSYGDVLVHNGKLAQAHQVELVSLGTELINMSLDSNHPDNTTNWRQMIARVRAVYSGKLTYGAHGNGDEDQLINFWNDLDYISTSPYYHLNADAEKSIASLKTSWEQFYTADIKPLSDRFGKPIMFGEIGFRSLPNVHVDPWNYARTGPANEADQARNYAAMILALKDKPQFAGIMLWDWDSNPNVGGVGDTNFTPQGKQAEQVMRFLWSGVGSPISNSVQVYYPQVREGEPVIIDAQILNLGSVTSGANIDVEVYDSAGRLVHQQIFDQVALQSESFKKLSFNFVPRNQGEYRVSVGVFSSDWGTLYTWGHHRGIFTAGPNPSSMRITSPVPSVLRQNDTYNLRWTDSTGGSRYNLLLRASGGKQWAIKWVAQPTVLPDGTRSFAWTVGEMTGPVSIPGDYYFTVCHDYSAPCTVSSIFKLEEGGLPTAGFSIAGESSSGLGIKLRNNSNTAQTALIDLELYDNINRQTAQKFFDQQAFAPGEIREYKFDPLFLSPSNDPYHFHVGVFKPGWQGILHWFHDVKVIDVAS